MSPKAKLILTDDHYRIEYDVRRCRKCLLSDTFPGISFDATGDCSYCTAPETAASEPVPDIDRLRDVIRNPDGDVDVVHLFSGGKDSTFALYKLFELGFRVVAMTYDNGFIAPEAIRNIERTAGMLGVEFVVRRLDEETTGELMREGLMGHDNAEALKYSTATCGICISTVLSLGTQEALKRGVGYMSGGWTPGQFTHDSIVPGNFIRKVCEGHFNALALRNPALKNALAGAGLTGATDFPALFNPLYVVDYNEAIVIRQLAEIGWHKPENTDSCSTNCLLNGYLVLEHTLRHGFHPYEYELAHHIRTGRLERSEGIRKIERVEVSRAAADRVAKRLCVPLIS